jgi:hypothetical protein
LTDKCRGAKRDGSQCTVTVNPPQTYCWWHDPANGDRRQRAASRGGKGKAGKVSKDLHALLETLTQQVIDGELETSRGAVANQLITTRIKLFEFERRLKETEELEKRIEELSEAMERQEKAGSRYGA